MKIRTDYVTNSSSSSFVIAYRNLPEFDEDTLVKYPFLSSYSKLIEAILFIEGYGDTTSGQVFKTKEEWVNNFVDEHRWMDCNTVEKILAENYYLKPYYDNAIKYLEDGFYILDKTIDYDDNILVELISWLAQDNDSFVILQED